ncbi:DUF2188 domain-containing protein [Vineibacter terrae]|uniref:DUF2188 domain-containing protein n=1 Tax=Vineibacter terrae TaxID=2586908 RepID=A0A5C8PDX5_9HYPH|nr:DUF2188 domain-containing protein [Vineibacter terrae]TXL71737.1 DUF2188 domain-containing protein [Vineibacter terrae]
MSRKAQHVIPSGGKWSVRSAGASHASGTFETKREASDNAREKARREGGELYIHGRDGRIREHSSFGRDPHQMDTQTITQIAQGLVRAQFGESSLERVITEPAIDSQGKDALRIILVLKPGAVRKLTGKRVIGVLVGMQQKFEAEGDERFPIVEYATEQELMAGNDEE